MKKAVLYGVGVGPGNPELMTIKAVRVLRDADVIGIPVSDHGSTAFHIACQAVPELAQKESCSLSFPMTRDEGKRQAAYRSNAAVLISYLASGKSVAFPVLGDPSIYSTYTYVGRLVAAAGYQTQMIPGIPSFSAAAAAAGKSLGEDDMQIHIFPVLRPQESGEASAVIAGRDTSDRLCVSLKKDTPSLTQPSSAADTDPSAPAAENLAEDFPSLRSALSFPGRKILMKGGRFSGQVRDMLLAEDMPAVMVENCGMENEKIYRSPEEFPEHAGYYSVILI